MGTAEAMGARRLTPTHPSEPLAGVSRGLEEPLAVLGGDRQR